VGTFEEKLLAESKNCVTVNKPESYVQHYRDSKRLIFYSWREIFMSNTTKLAGAIKFALFVGAASSVASVSAFAQEKDAAKTLDRVEVTGSRIKRVDAETTQPIAIVTRADIEKTGLTNVFDILNNITSSDGSGLSTTTTQTNGSDGSQQISLRGLGADRTLVLVDGKRWITDIDGTVDLSTIPVAIIERIDVLKDGASAIYGSDAIAGVVNIITRKNFEGAQFGTSYGQTTKGDGAQNSADITVGAAGERSSAVLSVSYSEQKAIYAGDRLISREPYFGCFEYYGGVCPYGSASGAYGRFAVAGSLIPGANGTKALNPSANIADGIQASDFRTFTSADRYNFSPINYLQQPAQRLNLFGAGRFSITDNISAYVRANYTKRYSNQQLAEVPATASVAGANGPQWKIGIASTMPFNPFGVAINTWNFRNVAVGPRNPSYDYDIFALQTGLEGSFELGQHYFSWDLSAARNDGQYDKRGTGYINLFNLAKAVGAGGYDAASNSLYCGATYATRIAGCIPYNVFGGPSLGLGSQITGAPVGRKVTAAEVQQMVNYVSYTQVSTSGNTTTNYNGSITGDLFELPAGMLSMAVGFEYRKDVAFNQPDTLVASGGSSDNFNEPTSGQTEVTEYFAEVTIPLLKDVFLAKELELRAAVRQSDYSASGKVGLTTVTADPGSPTNAMYGLKWKPMDDLMFRASYGESFRAPSAFDLYAGGGESFPSTNDPCRSNALGAGGTAYFVAANAATCKAAGLSGPSGFGTVQDNSQIRTLNGGDPTLKPEYGTNLTYGFVYSPSFAEGLDLTVDYWEVELKDVQSTLTAGTIMNRCLGTGGFTADPFFCTKVERTASGSVATVRTARVNLAEFRTSGIDLGGVYRWDAGDWGNFRFAVDTSWTQNRETRGSAASAWSDAVGNYDGSPNWEYRTVANVDWSKGDYSVRWTTRYMSDIAEDFCIDNSMFGAKIKCREDGLNHTGSYAVHDLNVAWKAPWDATVSLSLIHI
jgi:iron complex outermembrane receptor protein